MRMLLTRHFLATSCPLRRSLPALAPAHGSVLVVPSSSSHLRLRRHHDLHPVSAASSIRRSLSTGRDSTTDSKDRKVEAKSSSSPPLPSSIEAESNVPRRIVVKRRGKEETIDLANLKGRVGSLIPKKSRGYQRAVLRNRARAAATATSTAPITPEVLPVRTKPTTSTPASSSPFVPGTVAVLESTGRPAPLGSNEGGANSTTGAKAESTDPNNASSKKNRSKSRIRLPVINASALLDKQTYCLQSAIASTSRSGTDAALRLHKGRQELVAVIRREILSSQQQHHFQGAGSVPPRHPSSGVGGRPSSAPRSTGPPLVRPPPYYVLQGHGVPHQLLQAHIDFADALLRKCGATDVSFSNSALKVDFLRKRRAADNVNQVLPWSAVASGSGDVAPARFDTGGRGTEGNKPVDDEWTNNVQLYLTVMNRIANALGLILPPSKRGSGESSHVVPTPVVDEYENEWTEMTPAVPNGDKALHDLANGAVLKHWRAEFLFGRSVPPEWVPSSELASKHPQPLVEFTPLPGMAAPGRVTIRLQGYPSFSPSTVAGTTTTSETSEAEDGSTTTITRTKPLRRRRSQPVSLIFDACFRHV